MRRTKTERETLLLQAKDLEAHGHSRRAIGGLLNLSSPDVTRLLGAKQRWRDRRSSEPSDTVTLSEVSESGLESDSENLQS